MLPGCDSVLPGVFELSEVVVVSSLMMMMRGRLVMCRGLTMISAGGAFRGRLHGLRSFFRIR